VSGATASWRHELQRRALLVYGRIPERWRRRIIHVVAPSFTVGAICVIERPDGHVLLVRQVYRTRWGLPGGLMQRREEPAAAARREVREEVNLEVELLGEPAVVVDPVPRLIDIVFRARPVSLAAIADVRPQSPEIVEARWFGPEALPELQKEAATALVALARSARSPQANPLR
jgi:8-oxo-dGTP pyrophosphatase MutT (NUDIX family)